MNLTIEQLKAILVDPGHISVKDFEKIQKVADSTNTSLETVLLDTGLISEENFTQLVADLMDWRFIKISDIVMNQEIFLQIPENIAQEKKVVAFDIKNDKVLLAMLDPSDLQTVHVLEKTFGLGAEIYLIAKNDFDDLLSRYRTNIKEEFQNYFDKFKNKSLSEEERDRLAIDIVDLLLNYGYESKASDVHIEPLEKKVVIRYRVDGVLHTELDLPIELNEQVLTRIKILAKLRTDEHQAAQDGKLRFIANKEDIDVRVSVVPVTKGEKIVMRILAASSRNYTLHDLGFNEANLEKVQKAILNPHGMILVTGPTGSGKTTTLYAMLKILNQPEVNITTIEDPVEYSMDGVNQIQVNSRTDLTFAKGLRAIVRQDPDIIMVGEIRDKETASISVNAALTGHLVLSTLHTNDAATTILRLLDMGVEPFLVASTINISIAQRLVRKICTNCRVSYQLSKEEKTAIKKQLGEKAQRIILGSDSTVYKGKGCLICNHTGYTGRIGIFELLIISETIKELIMKQESNDVLNKQAIKEGMTTMLDDGIEKVISGVTTLEEVLRVTRD